MFVLDSGRMPPGDADLDHVASLADPARRAVYRFVVDHATGADRNQVAAGLDLSRSLAAYHLDRLVDDGLLVARFEHRGTKRGPGSGRPSKVYERARTDFEVSLPPRDYGLAAEVMAEALERLDDQGIDALRRAATRHGRNQREARGVVSTSAPTLDAVARQLEACGYEPYQRGDCLRMRNCPFDAIAREHRDLVCTMNLALLDGLLDADGAGESSGIHLELEPAEDECCVTIRTG
jgi:predicted ArsR family transcriptional regulator